MDSRSWNGNPPSASSVDDGAVRPPLFRRCRLEHPGRSRLYADHGLRYPCMSGAMANGIGSVEIVEAMGRAGMLGIFGAAGLPLRPW